MPGISLNLLLGCLDLPPINEIAACVDEKILPYPLYRILALDNEQLLLLPTPFSLKLIKNKQKIR